MNDPPRYLLGKGERLTSSVAISRGGGEKHFPYTPAEQRERLTPRLALVAQALTDLPAIACPEDRSVATLVLHPTFLAKTYFPDDLLRESGLRAVGSRPAFVNPRNGRSGPSSEIFVAGKRSAFASLADRFGRLSMGTRGALVIEDVRVQTAAERLRLGGTSGTTLEVVLHAPADWDSAVDGFDAYAEMLGFTIDIDRRRYLRDLCFMPVHAQTNRLNDLATYSFLRVARTMPRLRELQPASAKVEINPVTYSFPDAPAADVSLRVAIFDGGLASDSPLTKWGRPKEASNIGRPVAGSMAHGHDVTSAFLFGSLENGEAAPPYVEVDHYRVLDEHSHDPNGEYIDVLDRIVEVLAAKHYDFVNLSIGPHLPIEDDEVHPWTAKLDDLLSNGKTLLASAVGNDGEADRASSLARIQPPSDGVNLLSVGSCVPEGEVWSRASYSCIGPGRSPGLVKPDVVAFGGSQTSPFWVAGAGGQANATHGTSFASPNALRLAAGVRAHFGDAVECLGIRALLLHHAKDHGNPAQDVGWGVLTDSIADLVTCTGDTVHVLYQGIMEPRQYRRVPIPLPFDELPGLVTVRATFCIATETDPKDPFNYTRSGIVPTFRPHKDVRKPYVDQATGETRIPVQPTSAPFFKTSDEMSERELRDDAREWETVLRATKRFRGSSLSDPVFDIHYNPREGGANAGHPAEIPYALVVTVSAPRVSDLYERISGRYRTQLEPLKPVINVPIRIQSNNS